MAGQIALPKKQGVSGQSLALGQEVEIHVHEKDFRSKALIKEAIMENDFLKHLSQSQVFNFKKTYFSFYKLLINCRFMN